MGLDMYLVREKYIGASYEHNQVEGVIDIRVRGKKIPIDLKKINCIQESVGYWRKANQIHKWFVDNVQDGNDDGKSYYVSTEDLEKLLNICKEVKEKAKLVDGKIKNGEILKDGKWTPNLINGKVIQNAEEISKLLPTRDGFFFGSTDYDEKYLKDITDTIEMLTSILKDEKKLNNQGIYSDFEYSASW